MDCQLTITQNFYHLLIDTFQGEVGLTRVLNGQFMVLNGFNEIPFTKNSWRAGIQPKSRVAMAFILKSSEVRSGRCANPACPGQIEFRTDQVTRSWCVQNPCQNCCNNLTKRHSPICGKILSTLKDSPMEKEEYKAFETFSFEFGSDIRIPVLRDTPPQVNPPNSAPKSPFSKSRTAFNNVDKDIAAYKRVIWYDLEK